MKCPNCKNPIDEKSTVCEWCGANLNILQENKYSLDLSDIEDEFTDMNRSELKEYITDNDLDIHIRQSMTDNDLRAAIRRKEKEEEINFEKEIERDEKFNELVKKNDWRKAREFLNKDEELTNELKSRKTGVKIYAIIGTILTIGYLFLPISLFIFDATMSRGDWTVLIICLLIFFCVFTIPAIICFKKMKKYNNLGL